VETLDRLIKGVVRPLSDSSAAAKYRQVLFSNVKVGSMLYIVGTAVC